MGARRILSAHGMKAPAIAPQTSPENTHTVVTKDAAQRPPRYAIFEIGFVNNS